MGKKILRFLLSIIGAALGYGIAYLIINLLIVLNYINNPAFLISVIVYSVSALIGFIILFLSSNSIIDLLIGCADSVERKLQELPVKDVIYGVIGLIVGLIIAALISVPVRLIPSDWLAAVISVFIYILLGYLGINIAVKRSEEMDSSFSFKRFFARDKNEKNRRLSPKILDTSVIIDGRIFDICMTGFIEGELIIPEFVLEELRHIADSSDSLKRNRGRRGLDILNKMQKELDIPVRIYNQDFPDIEEVDSKLLKLAQQLNGKVLTNDYNLNKVAEFQGVFVLNINELANAVKPIVLPGEEMVVQVIKDGKESGQGVAYLDDGTMIVVDGGKKHVGQTIEVLVTSVLQTAAGRMIFAKPKSVGRAV
ncbi:MAG: PIN/TRAM domain-containing protein [Clostridia bacterium]|nr:PIN/TRAM domain-containing protein [Clostridia bacterium]